jgi:anti-sigma regulatory factor (Ser/Thr protein kinase)
LAVTGRPAAAAVESPGSWRLSLRLGAQELRQVDVVPALLELAAHFEDPGVGGGRLFVVLSELYNNALEHGLLRLDSRIKTADGMESWLAERESRLARLVKGEIELEIERLQEGGHQWLRIACRDSGPGFDRSVLPAREESDLPFGRGVAIVKALCARLQYNKAGNAVTAFLAIGEGSAD